MDLPLHYAPVQFSGRTTGSGRVLKAWLVTDGPYVEAKEIIVSFAIIQTDDYDAALAIARACPPGHTIEIREFAGYA